MTNVKKAVMAAGVAVALSACGANPSSAITPTNPANIAANVLEFSVGTANLYGTSKGVNVVVSYRQPTGGYNPGDSAVLVSSPSLHTANALPAPAAAEVPYDHTSTIWFGPAPAESNHLMTPTSQSAGAVNITTFGQSVGAFGIGLEPFNYYGPFNAPGPSKSNTPFQVAPFPVPLYEAAANPNEFESWGGPPAFDLLGNGTSPVGAPNVPAGTAGVSEGLDVFNMAPATGPYTLSVLVPTTQGNVTQHATARLNAATVLGNATAPALVANGSGGGSFTVAMPAGATEAYVQVTDYGPFTVTPPSKPGGPSTYTWYGGCNGANSGHGTAIYYTILAKSGSTVTLPNNAGPGGSSTLCTATQNANATGVAGVSGDAYIVQLIGFDYPMYESSYPASLGNPTPPITRPGGQDDVTISPAACATYDAALPCPPLPLPLQPALRGVHHGVAHAVNAKHH
ncbi:MAG: hypothetical protein JO199_05990 [Candidatus Eremiobacteraeota bacterium]|nr:hypothetical protein [Candidatus Eremiobacteraeota bacterium]